jgi:choline dehydrogenase-like flavoprotein
MSTALTHLAGARGRPNLTIRASVVVDRVELRGTTVRGIRLAGGETVDSDAVVLAAGCYASPAILLRSGIGPAAGLRDLGIQVAADLPGVGDNLIDHPLVAVDLPTAGGYAGPRFQQMLTLRSSRAAPDGPPDLHIFAASCAENQRPNGPRRTPAFCVTSPEAEHPEPPAHSRAIVV